MSDATDDAEGDAAQSAAEAADKVITTTFSILIAEGHSPGALIAGACTAVVRLTVQTMFMAPAVPNVRDVLAMLLRAINRAAEQQIAPVPPRERN